jgi:hypothetical protein
MTSGRKYAGIPVSLLRRCRTVLSRQTDGSGKVVWIAEIPNAPWCNATGSSRVEALDRVREMAERRSDDGNVRRRVPPKGTDAP